MNPKHAIRTIAFRKAYFVRSIFVKYAKCHVGTITSINDVKLLSYLRIPLGAIHAVDLQHENATLGLSEPFSRILNSTLASLFH